MKTIEYDGNYGCKIGLTIEDAKRCTHVGECYQDVVAVSKKPYVAKQIKSLDKQDLVKELQETGAWCDEELEDHKENVLKYIWLSAGFIIDNQDHD